ncbi:hypothetical protein CWE15_05370 [Aliidiomarina taiwanensis]|uniref:Polymer-forming cytoskeletal protein n=1 Tax=Aliidiomarina taiwanensis TaxID=946228 RepID=A0A432X7I9_9GAMM|nr:DUF6701 domain-containing protein [Aliidiomarina taiwanensis]RUO42834.1 hypothetical protein CWE15_05370 [Aliidiomarina taiwanensis]
MRVKLKWVLALVFLFAGVAEAATYALPNGPLPNNCSSSGQTVTCSSLNLNWDDKVIIQGSSHVTLKVNNDAKFSNAEVNLGGGPNKLSIEVGKDFISNSGVDIEANIVVSNKFELAHQGSLKGSVEAKEVSLGGESSIHGSVTVQEKLTAGSGVTIVGDINAEEIKVGSDSTITGDIVVSDKTEFGSRNIIQGGISAKEIKVGSDSAVTGNIAVSHKAEFGSRNIVQGDISAKEIKVGSDSSVTGHLASAEKTTINASSQISGNIIAKKLELNSHSTINGNIFVSGEVDIKAHNTIAGNIIGHDIDIGSNSSVEGDIDGYKVKLSSSSVAVTGNVTATTEIDIGSGSSISGDATADKIKNNGGNNDSAVAGDIYCNSRTNFARQCQPLSSSGSAPGGSGAFGIASCSAEFSTMLGYGVIGDADFEYDDKAKINNINITGSNGNTPTPQGVVDTVPTTFPALNPATFPAFSTGSINKTNESNIPPGSYNKIKSTNNSTSTQGGTYFIDEVEVGENDKLYLAAGEYYINTLELDEKAKLTLGSGDYFIKTADLDENAEVIIEPGATVRLYIKDEFETDENVKINHSNGSVASLSIFLYSDAELELGEKSKFTGFIYSPFSNTDIELDEKVHYEGGIISAGEVEFDEKVKVTFDEVDTYEQILEASGCNIAPPDPEVHHYRIVLPQQELVSCYAAPVTVKACANADCSSVYANTVEGTLQSNVAAAVWNGTNSNTAAVTFATGESTYGLSLVPGGSTTVSLNNLVPLAGNTTQCVDASGTATSCDILFKTAGLLVSAASPTAGVDTAVTVRAIETNTTTGACMARATGTQSVRLGMECSNPGSCAAGQSFTANGQPLSMYNNTGNGDIFDDSIANTSVALSFDSSGTATFNANYTDVGQIRIHAALDLDEAPNAGEPGIDDPDVTLSGTGSYVVRPHTLTVQGLDDDGNPVAATTDTGHGYKAAGEPFKVAIQSLNANGDITPSFGKESTPAKGSVAFDSVVFPNDGYGEPSDLDVEDLSTIPDQDNPGRLIGEGAVWNEAGTVNITAALKGGKYLGVVDTAIKPASTVGRFYPHHFIVASSAVTNSCAASVAESFSYLGQPEIGIDFTVHAVNASGDLVQNYGHANYAGVAAISAAAVDTTNGLPTGRLIADVSATWVDGVYEVALTDAEVTRRADNTPDGPFGDTRIQLTISNAEDNPFTDATEDLSGVLSLRYGRMVLENIYGPEDENLNVLLRSEYWDGAFFVKNLADNCTPISASNLAPVGASSIVSTPASAPGATLVNGDVQPGDLYWQAPTAGDTPGEFEFEYQAPGWLLYDWGSGGNENPTATAGFGVYRGNDRIIFSLERNF